MTDFDRRPFDENQYWQFPQKDGFEGTGVEKEADKSEKKLFLKKQRASFWEKHHSIPTNHYLMWE